MTLKEFIQLAKSHLVLLIALPLACSLVFGAYAGLTSKESYTAQSTLYLQAIQEPAGEEAQIATDASQLLVDDAVTLLQSKRVERAATEDLGLDSLGSCSVSVTRVSNSRVIQIAVTGDDSQAACDIANSLAENGSEVVHDYMKADLLRIVDSAEQSTSSGGTSVPLYAGVGLAGGLLLALLIVFASRYLDAK